MKITKSNIKYYLLAAAIVFCIVINVVEYYSAKNRLMKYGKWSTALITQSNTNKGTLYFTYKFYVSDSTLFEAEDPVPFDAGKPFIGKYFPVLYNPEDPAEHELFILESRFDKYDLPFPDSLHWIRGYTPRL